MVYLFSIYNYLYNIIEVTYIVNTSIIPIQTILKISVTLTSLYIKKHYS